MGYWRIRCVKLMSQKEAYRARFDKNKFEKTAKKLLLRVRHQKQEVEKEVGWTRIQGWS